MYQKLHYLCTMILEAVTKKTKKDLEAMYTGAIDTLVHFGWSEAAARKEVRIAFKETIEKLKLNGE